MPATIFSGQKIKTLKDTLTLNGKSDIISSMDDPTASAVDAPIGSLLINQTSGKLYRKLDAGSSVNWEEVGSGTGGINYILNPSAEVNTTGWATYADAAGTAPVDGTGGSPNVTWTRSTTSPLRGVADFNFAKDSANRQGQGVSYDFTIDEADKAKVLSVTFDYEVLSGTYADGDLTVYLIADPTGTPVVIQPAGYTVQAATVGTTMRQSATFQTQATGTSYRLCFHVASTSASAYTLAIDNVVVGPQSVVYGSPVTDWVSYTPVMTGGTASSITGKYRRVGDSIQVRVNAVLSAGGLYTVSVPFSVDSTKYPNNATNVVYGQGTYIDVSTGVSYTGGIYFQSSTTVTFVGPANGQWTAANPVAFGSGDVITVDFSYAAAGLSSSVQMSQDTDTRVVAAKYTTATSQSINTSSPVLVYETKEIDTHSAYNTSTGVYTVPVAGIYRVSAMLYGNAAATVVGYLTAPFLYKNGSFVSFLGGVRAETTAAAAKTAAGSTTVQCVAGDQLTIRGYSDTATSLQAGQPSQNHIEIERLSGPSTIAASEMVSCVYSSNTATVIGTTATTIPFEDKDFDTHGFYNPSTGIATIPVSGKYLVVCGTYYNSSAQGYSFAAVQGGSVSKTYRLGEKTTSTSTGYQIVGSAEFNCLAGDTLRIQATASAGGVGLFPLNELNHLSIIRVGN